MCTCARLRKPRWIKGSGKGPRPVGSASPGRTSTTTIPTTYPAESLAEYRLRQRGAEDRRARRRRDEHQLRPHGLVQAILTALAAVPSDLTKVAPERLR